MAAVQDQYDSAFLGILQNEGDIGKFLNSVFGFLFRRTDFYVALTPENKKMGFPPGVARKLTIAAFSKYAELADRAQEARVREKTRREEEKKISDASAPPVLQKVEVSSTESTTDTSPTQTESVTTQSTPDNTKVPPVDRKHHPSASQQEGQKLSGHVTSGGDLQKAEAESAGAKLTGNSCETQEGAEKDDHPELTKKQQVFQANPASYNGAITDNYAWSQSITDLDVHVQIPSHIRKARDVKVQIERKHLQASYKGSSGDWEPIVEGALSWEVNLEESMWSLIPGEYIHVNLEKVQERWWDAVLDSEDKISVQKIDPSRPMTELDEEAQAKIEEMMYNQRQKQLGLPQSHEQKMHGMLRKAWDAEGSPFKGQPFDPSKMNLSGENIVNIDS